MPTLLFVTLVSLTLAAVMSVVAWRAVTEERRRSNARVRVLAAEIDAARGGPVDAGVDLNIRPETDRPSARASSAAMLASGVLGIGTAAALVVVMGGSSPRTPGTSTTPLATQPLELLALDHVRDGSRLTVSGVVHNPSDAGVVSQLTPVVFVFDHNGDFVTSGRGTLEAATLVPGAHSTFVVAMPDVADVGRYRISFRTEDRVLAHVDRRAEMKSQGKPEGRHDQRLKVTGW